MGFEIRCKVTFAIFTCGRSFLRDKMDPLVMDTYSQTCPNKEVTLVICNIESNSCSKKKNLKVFPVPNGFFLDFNEVSFAIVRTISNFCS